jgi:UDP-N-acetylmuramyl tripeptide synthase
VVAVRHADATDIVLQAGRTDFTWRGQRITTGLTGAINVDNALLAAEAALALEELQLGPEEIARAMGDLSPVPGRLQVIAAPSQPPFRGRREGPKRGVRADAAGEVPPFTVIVDYAHTPAGLEVVLGEARNLAAGGRVVCVFGCGGNRDRAKRPAMGSVAARLSDLAVVTSDNPRAEDPLEIIEEVLGGIPGWRENPGVVVEPDRGVAIRRALDAAVPGDVVVVAGKGHETYQEVGGRRLPFDDAVEARQALSLRFGSDPSGWVAGGAATRPAKTRTAAAAPAPEASRVSHPEA